eukprot:UN2643
MLPSTRSSATTSSLQCPSRTSLASPWTCGVLITRSAASCCCNCWLPQAFSWRCSLRLARRSGALGTGCRLRPRTVRHRRSAREFRQIASALARVVELLVLGVALEGHVGVAFEDDQGGGPKRSGCQKY